jgi:hypothetical protein
MVSLDVRSAFVSLDCSAGHVWSLALPSPPASVLRGRQVIYSHSIVPGGFEVMS